MYLDLGVTDRPEEISGRRLIDAREAARLTQVQLAQLMEVDQTKVSRFELGKVPTLTSLLATIALYCEVVGCDWTEVLEPYFETVRQLEQVPA